MSEQNTQLQAVHSPYVKSENTNEEVIDLLAYAKTIYSYKWRLLALSFLTTFIATLIVLQLTPIYKGEATLMIESELDNVLSIEEVVGLDSSRKEYFLTQFEVIKSSTIAERVVRSLNLSQNSVFTDDIQDTGSIGILQKWFNFLPQPLDTTLKDDEREEQLFKAAVKKLRENTNISPIRNTQLVKISYESKDPRLAQQIANEIGNQYIKSDLDARVQKTNEANLWLQQRLTELSIELNQSEEKLNTFRQAHDIVDVQGIKGLVNQKLVSLSERIANAEERVTQTTSIYKSIQDNLHLPTEALKNIGEIASSANIQSINNTYIKAKSELEELKKVYGPKHPNTLGAVTELEILKDELDNAVKELANNVGRNLENAQQDLKSLRENFQATRSEYQDLTIQESEYLKLNRAVESNRQLYNTFLERIKETELAGNFGNAIARFTDRANLPEEPVKPKKKLVIALTFVASIMFGIMIIFLLDAINDTIRNPEDVEQKLKQRILAALPLIDKKEQRELAPGELYYSSSPMFAEAIRTMRTVLTLSKREKNSKVIIVTSTQPDEGKTTVSTNLAFSLGQMQKTLLIDADLRKPSVGKEFNISAFKPGVTDLVNGEATIEECIYSDPKRPFDVLPGGQLSPHPLELLSSEQFEETLNILKGQYERIIIDTPPTLAVSDSLVLSELCDAVLYVVKEDYTRIKPVMEGISRIIDAHGRISGIVLNQVSAKHGARFGYYGYGYGENYGDRYQPQA